MQAAAATAAAALVLLAPAPALGTFSITDFTASPAQAPAGSHPATSTVHMEFGGTVDEDVRNIIQHFPGGIIPNPEALPKCSRAQFLESTPPACPPESRLGPPQNTTLWATYEPIPGTPVSVALDGDVFNIEVLPPYVGGLGFVVAGSPLEAPFTVRSARHSQHDLTTNLPNIEADITQPIVALTARDYGLTGLSLDVPDHLEIGGIVREIKIDAIEYSLDGTPPGTYDPNKPYLTTTTACLSSRPKLEATTWDGQYHARDGNVLSSTPGSCDPLQLPYNPQDLGLSLGSTRTDTPSSYDLSINIPANENWGSGNDRHQPYLKRGSITLPEGTALSPPAAQGLQGCTEAQLGFGTQNAPTCPAGSDIGNVKVESKNVDHVINGNFYLGQPTSGHNYRVFIAFEIVDGLWVKLDGESFPDSSTGRVTTVFDDLPMLPFEKFTIELKGGDRAVLVNPSTCGPHSVTSRLTPWSGAITFEPARDGQPSKSFTTSYNGAGAACPDPFPFNPTVGGSTTPLQAGAQSNLSLALTNPDRDQLLKTLKTSLPPGLVGGLVGIQLCSVNDSAVGTCGAASQIGTVYTTAGSGNDPLPLPGSIYLAQPLQAGDPASLSIVVPAKAGPFDFGNVVVRARIVLRSDFGLDVTLVDNLPRIIEGIPIRLRTTGVSINRSNFMRNPTSCGQLQLGATFTSLLGTQKTANAPYQASGCAALPFSPKLRFVVEGETKKDGHPTLKAILTQQSGQANIAKSRVVLPNVIRPEVLALQRPGGLCSEAQLATRSCPSTSQVGVAKATTPLLPEALSGPVYIVQHAGNPLPKLVVFLDGRVAIRLEAQNELQSLKIVNRFDSLPDLPVSSFELTINGGKNGILKNFENLCKKDTRGEVSFTAHSGKTSADQPLIETPLNTPGCTSTAAPRASLKLKGVASGRPVLTLRVRRGPSGSNLSALSLALPRSLKVSSRKARKGVVVRSARKLRRSQWKLTRKGVLTLRKLPAAGVDSITAVFGKGVLKPRGALRKKGLRKRSVTFKLRVTDVQKHRFKVTLRVRPRS